MKKKPVRITLVEVIRIFEDIDHSLETCAIGWTRCTDDEPCSLHKKFKEVRGDIRSYLENTTMSSLLTAEEGKQSD